MAVAAHDPRTIIHNPLSKFVEPESKRIPIDRRGNVSILTRLSADVPGK